MRRCRTRSALRLCGGWTQALLLALAGCTGPDAGNRGDAGAPTPATDSVEDSDSREVISCAQAAEEFTSRVREAADARSHCVSDSQCVVRHASYACALDSKVRECGVAIAHQHTTSFVHTVSAIAADICTRVDDSCAVEVCDAVAAHCDDGVCVIVEMD